MFLPNQQPQSQALSAIKQALDDPNSDLAGLVGNLFVSLAQSGASSLDYVPLLTLSCVALSRELHKIAKKQESNANANT